MPIWPDFFHTGKRKAEPGDRVVKAGKRVAVAGEFVRGRGGGLGIRVDEVCVRLAHAQRIMFMNGDSFELTVQCTMGADGTVSGSIGSG